MRNLLKATVVLNDTGSGLVLLIEVVTDSFQSLEHGSHLCTHHPLARMESDRAEWIGSTTKLHPQR
jgi:hypothetical protein